MSRAVVIRKCATLSEALVVDGLLRDGGFLSSIDNYQHASNDWGSISAFGGVAVRVPESQLFPAGEYMLEAVETADERLSTATGDLDQRPLKTRYLKAWSMILIFVSIGEIILALLAQPIIWLLTLLPAEWFKVPTLTEEERAFGFYNSPVFQSNEPPSGIDWDRITDGVIFLGSMVLFLLVEISSITGNDTEITDKVGPNDPAPNL